MGAAWHRAAGAVVSLAAAAVLGLLNTGCARPRLHAPSPARELAVAPAERWESTLLLIGDAGAPGEKTRGQPDPVLRTAARLLREATGSAAVVFLGDNVYDDGYPPVSVQADASTAEERRARAILDQQVYLAGPTGDDGGVPRSIPRWFIAGNHDWGPRQGQARLAAQGDYLRMLAAGGASVELIPEAACPGPVARDVGRWLRVIAIDTQWWIEDPTDMPPGSCGGTTRREASALALEAQIAAAGERHVIVVAHHPLATAGPHGGNCSGFLKCLVRPFRIGASYLFGEQELSSPPYRRMRRRLEAALRTSRPLVFAAGHEHALQVFRGGGAQWYLGSGSGNFGHTSKVGCRRASTFALDEGGFMRIDATTDGQVQLTVVTPAPGGSALPVERYRRWLAGPRADAAPGDGANC